MYITDKINSMGAKKNILAIIGSASQNSSNQKLVERIANLENGEFDLMIYKDLKTLPHFDPQLSSSDTPEQIIKFREAIEKADGVIICTPEYIFSIPSGLKNALEWCISPSIFFDKPCGLITASASGHKGHEQLQLIMKTAMAKFSDQTSLLIRGVKGRFDIAGNLIDKEIEVELKKFMESLVKLIKEGKVTK